MTVKYLIRKNRAKNKISINRVLPKLVVFRSNAHVYAQVISVEGKVVAAASDLKYEKKDNKTERAERVGKIVATSALKAGIKSVVFDKNGYRYHGRVAKLAEAARQSGLKF